MSDATQVLPPGSAPSGSAPSGSAPSGSAPSGSSSARDVCLCARSNTDETFSITALSSPAARARLFAKFSASGSALTSTEFERLAAELLPSIPTEDDATETASTHQLGCIERLMIWSGLERPNCSMLEYLCFYHTILWVVCRAPEERHIPVPHRLGFLALSFGFNILVLIAFMASDLSLEHAHCGDTAAQLYPEPCTSLVRSLWGGADVIAVAVIDTACWPLLRTVFFWSHHPSLTRPFTKVLKTVTALASAAAVGWVLSSAWGHGDSLSSRLSEFLSTWPTARFTEALKLMSLWGVLIEYGPLAQAAPPAVAPRRTTSHSKLVTEDSKCVPLLADQHQQ